MGKSMKKPLIEICILMMFLTLSQLSLGAQRVFQPDYDRLDAFIEKEMAGCRIPGFSLAIVHHDEILYSKGYGIAERSGHAVTPETPFLIASLSKSFTALAILQLMEDGELDINLPVTTYLPWFSLADEQKSSTITVRELLNHTSGLGPLAEYEVATLRGDDTSIEALVRKMETLPTEEDYSFQYNNANYIILGAIIEQVSGMSYGKFIQLRIFDPLGMKQSFTNYEAAQAGGIATGYRSLFGFPVPVHMPYRTDFLPAYSIVSSTNDLAAYVIALQNSGMYNANRIISEDGLERMFKPEVQVSEWESYGFGWFITESSVYHGGETTNYQAKIKILTDDSLAVIILYNTSSSTLSTLFNVGYRDRIESGIFNIIYGYAPDFIPKGAGIFDLNRYPIGFTYTLYLLLILVISLRLLVSMYNLKYYRKYLSVRRKRLTKSMLLLVSMHVVTPLTILISVPLITDASWMFIVYYYPDIGVFTLVVVFALMVMGVFKFLAYRRHVAGL